MQLTEPRIEFFCDAEVDVDKPQGVGRTPRGVRRLIPILGGSVKGDGWTARILPGGADFQLIVSETAAELDARYTLETDGGELIFVQNRAVRSASPEVMARLIAGEKVDPSQVYFRCSPTFETASKKFAWINERMFVGSGMRLPDKVVLRFYLLA